MNTHKNSHLLEDIWAHMWRVLSCPGLCLLCVELLVLHCASTYMLLLGGIIERMEGTLNKGATEPGLQGLGGEETDSSRRQVGGGTVWDGLPVVAPSSCGCADSGGECVVSVWGGATCLGRSSQDDTQCAFWGLEAPKLSSPTAGGCLHSGHSAVLEGGGASGTAVLGGEGVCLP